MTTPITEFSHNSLTSYSGNGQKFLDARLASKLAPSANLNRGYGNVIPCSLITGLTINEVLESVDSVNNTKWRNTPKAPGSKFKDLEVVEDLYSSFVVACVNTVTQECRIYSLDYETQGLVARIYKTINSTSAEVVTLAENYGSLTYVKGKIVKAEGDIAALAWATLPVPSSLIRKVQLTDFENMDNYEVMVAVRYNPRFILIPGIKAVYDSSTEKIISLNQNNPPFKVTSHVAQTSPSFEKLTAYAYVEGYKQPFLVIETFGWGAIAGTAKALNSNAPSSLSESPENYTSIISTIPNVWSGTFDNFGGCYWPLQLPDNELVDVANKLGAQGYPQDSEASVIQGPCIRQIRLGQNSSTNAYVGAEGWTTFKLHADIVPQQDCFIYMI